jgi:DNA invertase Pin-like site-specific DNA recombinase
MIDLRDQEAAAYLRASDDKARGSAYERFSTSGQQDDALDIAAEIGVNLPPERIFCDNDMSASKYGKQRRKTKRRDDWDKLLQAIEDQTFKVLILWECSRGSRDHLEWAQFLDLIVKKKILVYVITKGRALDPTDNEDWEILANEGVKSASESNKISARVHRGVRRARREGRPLGLQPFGWMSEYDPKSGKMITWVPVEPGMSLVREMIQRVAAGEALVDIAVDFNKRTELPEDDPQWVPLTRRGVRWRPEAIKNVISSPTHIGKRWVEKDGKRTLVDGAWDAAVDEELWWIAYNRFHNRKNKTSRPGRWEYLLSGVARCGVCGALLISNRGQRGRIALRCSGLNDDGTPKPMQIWGDDTKPTRGAHVSIVMKWADDAVRDAIVKRLMSKRVVRDLTADTGEEEARARAEAAKIRAEIEAWKALAMERAIDAEEYREYKERWEPEAARLEKAAEAGMRPGATIALKMVEEAEEAGMPQTFLREALNRTWEKVPLQAKRDLIDLFLVSVTVHRGRRGCRTLEPGRIVIEL